MSSADRTSSTWPRNLPAPEPESDRSLTPPPPGFPTHGVAPSGQGENVERLGSPPYALANFAKFPDIEKKPSGFDAHLQALADIAMHEEWRGNVKNKMKDHGLLHNFLGYSFEFIEQEQPEKRFKSKDGKWTVYDTRLISTFENKVEPIYAVFERDDLYKTKMCENVQHGGVCKYGAKCWFAHSEAEIAEVMQTTKWVFKEWCIGWGHALRAARWAFGPDAPPPYDPNLCSGSVKLPSTWMYFDARLKIVYDVDHILNDNLERLEKIAVDESKDDIATRLFLAIEYAKKPVLNPRRVLPQLYCDRVRKPGLPTVSTFRPQLLMPLHLMRKPAADLALTLQLQKDPDNPECWYYYASTVLTIGMAYMNARMFDSVESPWLREAAMDGANEEESGFEDLGFTLNSELNG